MQVLIPAGGRGARLRPLTNTTPKPLLPLGDRPILTRIVESLPPELPVTVMVTPELRAEFEAWLAGLEVPNRVRLYVEQPLTQGPPGPVVALSDCLQELELQDDLLVMMGDSIHPFRMGDFLESGTLSGLRIAAYRLPDPSEGVRFGVLELGAGDEVLGFEEKPARPRSPWIFTGCLALPGGLLPELHRAAATGMPQMGHLVMRFLETGVPVSAFRAAGEWHDIGTFRSYLAAHEAFAGTETRTRLEAGGNRIEGIVYVHPSAEVSGSRLADCIVSAGASIRDADLRDCVIQANVSVSGRVLRGTLVAMDADYSLQGL